MLPVPAYYYNGKKTRPDETPHLRVSKDIDYRTAINIRETLRMMERERNRNDALEKYKKEREDKKASYPAKPDKKRSAPDSGPDKRVTIRDALAEIDMFQTEHLKLREQVALQQRLIGNLHKRLKWTENLITEHLSMNSSNGTSSVPSAEVITSAVSSLASLRDDIEEIPLTQADPEKCTCCYKIIKDCKCFD